MKVCLIAISLAFYGSLTSGEPLPLGNIAGGVVNSAVPLGLGIAGGATGTGGDDSSLAGKIGRVTGAVGMGALQGGAGGNPGSLIMMAMGGGKPAQQAPSDDQIKAAVNAEWGKMTPNQRYEKYQQLPPNAQAKLWALLSQPFQLAFIEHSKIAQQAWMFKMFMLMQQQMMMEQMKTLMLQQQLQQQMAQKQQQMLQQQQQEAKKQEETETHEESQTATEGTQETTEDQTGTEEPQESTEATKTEEAHE
jgi:hypothetical protein